MKFFSCFYFILSVFVIQFFSVVALPIDGSLPGAKNFLPSNGEVIEEAQYSDTEQKRSVPTNTESFTAGDFIYHTYERESSIVDEISAQHHQTCSIVNASK